MFWTILDAYLVKNKEEKQNPLFFMYQKREGSQWLQSKIGESTGQMNQGRG